MNSKPKNWRRFTVFATRLQVRNYWHFAIRGFIVFSLYIRSFPRLAIHYLQVLRIFSPLFPLLINGLVFVFWFVVFCALVLSRLVRGVEIFWREKEVKKHLIFCLKLLRVRWHIWIQLSSPNFFLLFIWHPFSSRIVKSILFELYILNFRNLTGF